MVFDTADVNWMSSQGILDKVIVSAKFIRNIIYARVFPIKLFSDSPCYVVLHLLLLIIKTQVHEMGHVVSQTLSLVDNRDVCVCVLVYFFLIGVKDRYLDNKDRKCMRVRLLLIFFLSFSTLTFPPLSSPLLLRACFDSSELVRCGKTMDCNHRLLRRLVSTVPTRERPVNIDASVDVVVPLSPLNGTVEVVRRVDIGMTNVSRVKS